VIYFTSARHVVKIARSLAGQRSPMRQCNATYWTFNWNAFARTRSISFR
jgi:hypothetical protein